MDVYFILSNGADPPYVTSLDFVLDGENMTPYTQPLPASNIPLPDVYYNTSVFATTSLIQTPLGESHTLTVTSFKGAMFDYAVYRYSCPSLVRFHIYLMV